MNRVSILASVALGAAMLAGAQTAPPASTKVGIIHIQNAIISTQDGQKAAKALEAKSAPKKKELEQLQTEIAGLRDQLNKTSNVGGEAQKQNLMREIDTKTKQFNRQVEDAQAELDQEQNRVLQELGGKMLTVIDKYAKDNGYTLILDVSSQQTPVLYAANGIDITQEVVALYDKNAPAATSSTGVGAPGAAGQPAVTRPAPGTVAPGTVAPATTTPRPVTPAPKPGATK
jgi:outer membrane protein